MKKFIYVDNGEKIVTELSKFDIDSIGNEFATIKLYNLSNSDIQDGDADYTAEGAYIVGSEKFESKIIEGDILSDMIIKTVPIDEDELDLLEAESGVKNMFNASYAEAKKLIKQYIQD